METGLYPVYETGLEREMVFCEERETGFFRFKRTVSISEWKLFFPFPESGYNKILFYFKITKSSQAEACVCCALLTVFQLFTAFILTMLKTSFVIFSTGQLNTSLKSQQCLIFINKA